MVIIFNPVAGRSRRPTLERICDALTGKNVQVELIETQYRGHARQLAREAAMSGEQTVVAAGGDGTVSEVASGLLGSQAILGIIPIGTANVLAKELDLPFAHTRIAAALACGRTRQVWPGTAHSKSGTHLFMQMVGIGFDGYVVHNTSPTIKRKLGRAAYILQALSSLGRYPYERIMLRLDGVETHPASAIISKGRLYGGRFDLAPAACPYRRGFIVTMFDWGNATAAMIYGTALALGLIPRSPGVRQVFASDISVHTEAGIPVQIDGDKAGTTPLCVRDAPAPIHVITDR